MTSARIIAATLLACLGSAHAQPADDQMREPYQMVRSLQMLQDQIARGDLDAHNSQPALLKRLGENFLKADAAVWKEPRNSRAAVTFLLSGGSPQVVASLRSRNVLNIDEAIVDGAIAYVEGRTDEAKSKLANIKPRSLPAALGAEIALVQSALVAQDDLKVAIALLDEVRLMMPGTLVEEAALRREIFIVGQDDDFDKFEALAVRYFRRYRHSIYAGNFRQRFALSVARFSFVQRPDRFPRLVAVLDHLDRASQRALYLLIARTALVRGKTEMTVLAADRVFALSDDDSAERVRARLYRAAARVATSAHSTAIAELEQIDKAKLSERDVELQTAALAIGLNVRKALPEAKAKSDGSSEVKTAMRPRIDFSRSLAAVDRAQKLLDASQEQLKEKTR
ncbi:MULTISPECIES: chemotaxis protein [unclassified Tardiphaga]|jgi:chemotaxis protein MotC|uniref:chemotaxis protein n=1 Tax=unclassified Tardiphaga TaxID=2631404 RepID=UPI000B6BAB79|nr:MULTISPECIES: chemotaxis protein [unclassified Tardiphaga]WNV12592.1 chemotaxis protein [Tardiphaga sp. 709]SNS53959.1 chemotaxis protein MotC [Tardiphaga sp. OK246]